MHTKISGMEVIEVEGGVIDLDKPQAPSITFADSGSFYAFFREAEGWVVSLSYWQSREMWAPEHPANVYVIRVDDDGLTVCKCEDGVPYKEQTWKVGYNDIRTFLVQ
jgi:hypothetical protein